MAESLKYEPRDAWKKYATEEERAKLAGFAESYLDFLSRCKTERETVAWAAARLREAGFTGDSGSGRFFVPFREKALFAASRGSAPLAGGLNLIASHGDSPRLDLKQHPFTEQAGIGQARTHYYGGIRKYQWLARPLALHGVVVLENGEKRDVSIGDAPEDPVFCVADLLPHLAQKQATQTLKEAFEGEKLNIVIGSEPSGQEAEEKTPVISRILEIINARYGIGEEDLISAELEAVPAGRARFVGFDKSLLGGYGQDDRICVYCAIEAFLAAQKNPHARSMAAIIWDKEEIGSDGATGASSRFLQYCIEDITRAWGEPDLARCLMNTRALSADVTAALDPDYQDVHEKQNAARMGHGPCFSKFTGSRGKYGANDADPEYFALLRGQLNRAGIPWQAAELGKVDLGGGGTVALFLASYGMRVIDLGPALLSMHSPFELSSVADLYATFEAYRVFYESAE